MTKVNNGSKPFEVKLMTSARLLATGNRTDVGDLLISKSGNYHNVRLVFVNGAQAIEIGQGSISYQSSRRWFLSCKQLPELFSTQFTFGQHVKFSSDVNDGIVTIYVEKLSSTTTAVASDIAEPSQAAKKQRTGTTTAVSTANAGPSSSSSMEDRPRKTSLRWFADAGEPANAVKKQRTNGSTAVATALAGPSFEQERPRKSSLRSAAAPAPTPALQQPARQTASAMAGPAQGLRPRRNVPAPAATNVARASAPTSGPAPTRTSARLLAKQAAAVPPPPAAAAAAAAAVPPTQASPATSVTTNVAAQVLHAMADVVESAEAPESTPIPSGRLDELAAATELIDSDEEDSPIAEEEEDQPKEDATVDATATSDATVHITVVMSPSKNPKNDNIAAAVADENAAIGFTTAAPAAPSADFKESADKENEDPNGSMLSELSGNNDVVESDKAAHAAAAALGRAAEMKATMSKWKEPEMDFFNLLLYQGLSYVEAFEHVKAGLAAEAKIKRQQKAETQAYKEAVSQQAIAEKAAEAAATGLGSGLENGVRKSQRKRRRAEGAEEQPEAEEEAPAATTQRRIRRKRESCWVRPSPVGDMDLEYTVAPQRVSGHFGATAVVVPPPAGSFQAAAGPAPMEM